MEFFKTSKAYYLTKSTYINLRWIAIIGQFITINSVKFIFNFEFNYLLANFIIFLGTISNLFLINFYNNSQISNKSSFTFLLIDIIQLIANIFLQYTPQCTLALPVSTLRSTRETPFAGLPQCARAPAVTRPAPRRRCL